MRLGNVRSWSGHTWQDFRRLHWTAQLGAAATLVVIVTLLWQGGRWAGGMVRGAAAFSAVWQRESLTARDLPETPGFRDREAELARLGELWESQPVIASVGPPLCGKTWLIAKFLRDQGVEDRTVYIEMKEGRSGAALMKAINAALLDRGCTKLDGICRREKVSLDAKTERLGEVMAEEGWVLALDSYERVGPGDEIDTAVRALSTRIGKARLLLGTRLRPKWVGDGSVVTIGPMPRDELERVCRDVGLTGEEAERVCEKLGPLPGAVGVFRGVVKKKGPEHAAKLVRGSPEEIGNRLFKEAFGEAPTNAQIVWMVASWFPAPLSRQAAEAMCGEGVFADGVQVLEDWRIVSPGSESLQLHECARWAGARSLRWRWWTWPKWRKRWGREGARYYGNVISGGVKQKTLPAENLLAAAGLAFQYEEWDALWGIGGALSEPLMYGGRWTAREELLRLCADGAAKARDQQARAVFTHDLGVALQQRGKLPEAEDLYRQSLEIARQVGNQLGIAASLHELGNVAYVRGKLPEAEDLYRQSLEIARQGGHRPGEAKTLARLGMVAYLRGKLPEAEDLLQRSLEIAREVGDRPGEAKTVHCLGSVALIRGHVDKAETQYRKALQMCRQLGMRPEEAMALHQLGIAAQDRGKLPEAEHLYRESLEIEREVGNRPGEAKTLHQMAMVAQDRGKLEEAEDLYRQSLKIRREVGDRPGEATTLAQMALLAEARGDLRLAVERMEKAHGMFTEMGLAEAQQTKGDLDRLRKRLAEEGGAGRKG